MARILVIDDDDQVRVMLQDMLQRAGHEVITATDGDDGVNTYRRDPTDLVITDIFMPEKEGLAAIQELRSEFPAVQIIALSGGGKFRRFDFLETAERFGAAATLRKPVEWEELIETVAALLPGPAGPDKSVL